MEGKVIAITGGASGIGLATAQILASRGALLSISDINSELLNDLRLGLGAEYSGFMFTKVDVTSRKEIDDWLQLTVKTFGRLDGAANCAGIMGPTNLFVPLTEMEDEQWHTTIAVNLTGMMHSIRAELQNLSKGGSIVSIASVAGLQGIAGASAYSTSKHGVIGMVRSVAKEIAAKGIRINAVAPGSIHTPMLLKTEEDTKTKAEVLSSMRRHGKPEEVATLIAWLLGDESTFVTGSVYTVDGGFHC